MPASSNQKEDRVLVECAVLQAQLQEKVIELERRCNVKDAKIEQLETILAATINWQNKALGYALGVGMVAGLTAPLIQKLLGG